MIVTCDTLIVPKGRLPLLYTVYMCMLHVIEQQLDNLKRIQVNYGCSTTHTPVTTKANFPTRKK